MESQRIYQRTYGADAGSIHVTGTYAGITSAIQARVVQHGTSTEVVGWTTIDNSPSGGTFSGSLTVPVGGQFNLQVRAKNNTSIVSNGSNPWSVGMVIAVIGQSNAEYLFLNGTGTPNTDVRLKNSSGWGTLTGSGAIALANKLNDALGIPVGLANYGVGGAALEDPYSTYPYWLDLAAGQPYALFKTGMGQIDNDIEAMIWTQGESDAFDADSEAVYLAALETFIPRVRTDLSLASLNVFFGVLGNSTAADAVDATWQGVRNAQYSYVSSDADAYLGATHADIPRIDNTHHTDAGYATFGERLGQSVLNYLDSSIYTYGRGGYVSSFSVVNSTTVDVSVVHRGSSTDIAPATGITGFEIFDDAAAETITSADRLDANTVRLTVSGSLDGTITCRYLYGNNPDVTNVLMGNTALPLPFEDKPDISQI